MIHGTIVDLNKKISVHNHGELCQCVKHDTQLITNDDNIHSGQ